MLNEEELQPPAEELPKLWQQFNQAIATFLKTMQRGSRL